MNRSPPDRQRAELAGRLAEWLALCYLTLTGHRLLARRFQSSFGEIDLVVRRRKVIIFCEVKFRHRQGDDGLPSPRQRRRICRASVCGRCGPDRPCWHRARMNVPSSFPAMICRA